MKKIFALIVCTIVIFSFAGCGKDETAPVTENETVDAVVDEIDESAEATTTDEEGAESENSSSTKEEEQGESSKAAEEEPQGEVSVSGEELVEKVEKLDEVEDPEEREKILSEIQTILEQAEKNAK